MKRALFFVGIGFIVLYWSEDAGFQLYSCHNSSIHADMKRPDIETWLYVVCCSDPNGAMLAFYDMMKKSIVMPAHLMDDLEHEANNDGRNLFKDFSSVAQATETYTGKVSFVARCVPCV